MTGAAAGVSGLHLHADRACGRNGYRGCLTSDKHALKKKVSLSGLRVVLFRVDA